MKFWITMLASLVTGLAMAQDFTLSEKLGREDDAVTARSMGLAGAFGGVGADISNATSNPAGMALYRKKELILGVGGQSREVESSFLNQSDSRNSTSGQLTNIGYVYTDLKTEWIGDSLTVRRTGLVSTSFAIGMNVTADYDEVFRYDEVNNNNSLLTSYVQTANQFSRNDIGNLDIFELQALDVDLLSVVEENGIFRYNSPISSGGLEQSGLVQRSGAKRDFFLSGGANISNKLYLGASLDIPWVLYDESSTYSERDVNGVYADFNSLEVIQSRGYEGVGARINLGAIYRLNDYLRVGLKGQTPTVLDMSETVNISTVSNFGTTRLSQDNFPVDEYVLTLPWNAGAQLVASHPKFGLISLEADYIDYSSTRIEYTTDVDGQFDSFEEAFKDDVEFFYTGALALRGGIEARLARNIRLRGGVAIQESPYADEAAEFGADHSRKTMAVGAGYRIAPANMTIDLGINRVSTGEFNSAYVLNNTPNSAINDEETFLVKLNVSKRFNR